MKKIIFFGLLSSSLSFAKISLDKIQLPPGFKIEVLAENLSTARQLAFSPSGVLYVASMDAGNIYAVKDKKTYTLAKNYTLPVGVVFHKGDLYFSALNRIMKIQNVEANLAKPAKPVVVYDKLPTDKHHGWKYLAIGPDEKLYLSIGANCNICEVKDPYATLARMNLDGSNFEIIARGVRNSVGFTWEPGSNKLYFTENNRDMMGDDMPPCELNRLDQIGEHFGYPYCHGGDIPDDKFNKRKCAEFKAPVQNLVPHSAPLGLKFYTGKKFPAKYRNLFIAEHGSWNRSKKVGYRITMVELKDGKAVTYTPFATGWLDEKSQEAWGRPVDLLETPEGDLLVSDDEAHAVYKISYK